MANLSDLPTELVERVLDFSPCESRLTLRRTCKNLCVKTSRSFCLEYFTDLEWTLSAANARALVHFSQNSEVVSHLTALQLVAPRRARNHDNIWVAKDIDPAKLAINISQFTQLRTLVLDGFSRPGLKQFEATTFVRQFSKHFVAPLLHTLCLSSIEASQRDITKLITSHTKTLTRLHLKRVNLNWTKSQEHEKRPRYHSPWSDLLLSIRCLMNDCEIQIDQAYNDGADTYLSVPRWKADMFGKWEAKDCGLTVSHEHWDLDRSVNPFSSDSGWEPSISIVCNSKWRKGVEIVSVFHLFDLLYYDEGCIEEAGLNGVKRGASDEVWQKILENLLNEKEKRLEVKGWRQEYQNKPWLEETETLERGTVLSQLSTSY